MENKVLENNTDSWIKELVRRESDTDASSHSAFLEDVRPSQDELTEHSVEFLKQLKTAFSDQFTSFNHLKGFSGNVKIYGIADTAADFMLFRKGHKLVFSLKEPGLIAVKMKFNDQILNTTVSGQPADLIKGEWGPFNELKWIYNDQPLNINYLIKYYITYFVKNSAR